MHYTVAALPQHAPPLPDHEPVPHYRAISVFAHRTRHSDLRAGDGRCPICDSYVRPATLVRVCDECNYGSYEGRCVICGGSGISDAYYCKECTLQEKDVRTLSSHLCRPAGTPGRCEPRSLCALAPLLRQAICNSRPLCTTIRCGTHVRQQLQRSCPDRHHAFEIRPAARPS